MKIDETWGRTSIKFSVTHDPAGGFQKGMDGLILAGHTHCGQISLPFVGAIWIPSTASREATCGLYEDTNRTIFIFPWLLSGDEKNSMICMSIV